MTHLAASDAVEIFNQFIVLHPYGSMVAVPVANQVVITENSTLIRRLIDVKNLIDIPAPEKKSEFITLAQANADRVVELITTILEKRQEGGVVEVERRLRVRRRSHPFLVCRHLQVGRRE